MSKFEFIKEQIDEKLISVRDRYNLTNNQTEFIKSNFDLLECNKINVFLSYSSKDKKIVSNLKEALTYLGLESFMAHDDIQPSEEWQNRILSELRELQIFIAVMTKNFSKSDWTNQEVGAAIIRDVIVIPVSLAYEDDVFVVPKGFIGKYQSLNIKINKINGVPQHDATGIIQREICKTLVQKSSIVEALRNCYVNTLTNSSSYAESNSITDSIDLLKPFNVKQLRMIMFSYLLNDQIYNSSRSSLAIKSILRESKDKLDNDSQSIAKLIL